MSDTITCPVCGHELTRNVPLPWDRNPERTRSLVPSHRMPDTADVRCSGSDKPPNPQL